MDESGTDEANCRRKVASEKRVAGAIRILAKLGVCSLSVLASCMSHCWCMFLRMVAIKMKWNEKERSRIWDVQMDNLRGLLGIRRMDKVPNARIRQLCGATKVVDERIDEGVLRWFGHLERMENDTIAKRVYAGKCTGSRL